MLNVSLLISVIGLAKEMFKYWNKKLGCPKQAEAEVKSVKEAFKTKQSEKIKEAIKKNV